MTRLHKLNVPIKKDQVDALREQFEQLQGNILKGFGKKNSIFIFLEFKNSESFQAQAQQWIRDFAPQITSAQYQIDDKKEGYTDRLCRSFFISAKGYEYFGLLNLSNLQKPFKDDEAFCFGMRSAKNKLQDSSPIHWEKGYQKKIHAMILLTCNNIDELQKEQTNVLSQIGNFSIICLIEHGQVLFKCGKYVEPFGYADSISLPIFFEADIPREEDIVWRPGPGVGPSLVLVPDPHGKQDRGKNGLVTKHYHSGSYIVFRKLQQDVDEFKTRLERYANNVGLSKEAAAARIIGRYQNGTPLIRSSLRSLQDDLNNFNYDDDPDGDICPLNAHIRKMNPRNNSNIPRIVRRSIPYNDKEKSESGGVGLLFTCYQNNITAHFQRLQKWANKPNYPQHGAGVDSIISQPEQDSYSKRDQQLTFYDLVTLRGGEYFFAPSIYTLEHFGET